MQKLFCFCTCTFYDEFIMDTTLKFCRKTPSSEIKRNLTQRQQRLPVSIKDILNEHEDNQIDGARRMMWRWNRRITVSYNTVSRIMKQHGLLKKAKCHPNGIPREDALISITA